MKTVHYKGYTILEVIIVLAVSSAMFGFVAVAFGGRQQQVQFTQAVRDFDSQLKNIMNDVSVGYYAKPDNLVCEAVGNSVNRRPVPAIDTSESPELGTNEDCIFIGKAIQFSPSGSAIDAEEDQIMRVYNVVGLRIDENGSNPTTIADAVPRAAPGPVENQLKWGLKVKRMIFLGDMSSESSGLAFLSSLNKVGSSTDSQSTENVKTSIVPDVSESLTESEFIDEIELVQDKLNDGSMSLSNAPKVVICVTDANDDRKATVTFGGNFSGSVIDFDNYDETVCAT
jgi:type II secretory pathway pseudopilin PulG